MTFCCSRPLPCSSSCFLENGGSSLQSCSESHSFKALLRLIRLFLLLLTLQSSGSLWPNYSSLHFHRYHDVRRAELSASVISPPWPSFRCWHQLLRFCRNVCWPRSLFLVHSMIPTFLTNIEFHFREFMFIPSLYALCNPICRYPVPQRSETQGRSEEYLGHWIRSRKITRDRIVLATKVCLSLCACVSRIAIFLQLGPDQYRNWFYLLLFLCCFRWLFVESAFLTFLWSM